MQCSQFAFVCIYIYIHVRISKARGTSTSKLLMTEVEGSLFGIYTDFTMVHWGEPE